MLDRGTREMAQKVGALTALQELPDFVLCTYKVMWRCLQLSLHAVGTHICRQSTHKIKINQYLENAL